MLSDVTTQLRDRLLPLVSTVDASDLFLTLRLMEMEARHMETTIEYLTGRQHVPLCGWLLSAPIIDLQRSLVMLKVSALLSLLKIHLLAHEAGGAAMPPEAIGTVARLLSTCEAEVTSMEEKLYGVDPAPVDLTAILSTKVVSLAAFAESRPSKPNDTN